MNRTLLDMTRALLLDSKLPKTFWAEALATAAYTRNRVLTSSVPEKTPYESWHGEKPEIGHMRAFGSKAFILNPAHTRSKLDPRSRIGIFVGYVPGLKGYKMWDPSAKRFEHTRDVVFREDERAHAGDVASEPVAGPGVIALEYASGLVHNPDSTIVQPHQESVPPLDEFARPVETPETNDDVQQHHSDVEQPSDDAPETQYTRRSERQRRLPSRYDPSAMLASIDERKKVSRAGSGRTRARAKTG